MPTLITITARGTCPPTWRRPSLPSPHLIAVVVVVDQLHLAQHLHGVGALAAQDLRSTRHARRAAHRHRVLVAPLRHPQHLAVADDRGVVDAVVARQLRGRQAGGTQGDLRKDDG